MGQKITIDPVTRVEGHARVSIHLNDDEQVSQTYLHIDQFRGFETEGGCSEMPSITPRICGICPVSHHPAGPGLRQGGRRGTASASYAPQADAYGANRPVHALHFSIWPAGFALWL